MPKSKDMNRRDFLKKVGWAGAAGLGSIALGRRAWAAKDIEGGQEVFQVGEEEKGGTLNLFVWNGYDADGVLNPFRKRYDCKINVELLTDDPDAIMKLKAGATRQFNILVLNNVWSRGMYKDGLIKPLDIETFKPYFKFFPSRFQWPYEWAMAEDGNLLGMPQRYGPFNFVISTKGISKETAQEEGWNLFNDPKNKGKWALLNWDNWVLYQMSQAAGVYPFRKHTDEELKKVEEIAFKWFKNAKFVTESEVEANNALINREIDFYVCGGNYTASPPRREGRLEVTAITPRHGPMKGGGGGIVWMELTNVINNPKFNALADDFVAYLQEPDVAYLVAMADSTHNPVANMGDPKVFGKFTKKELDSFQWDDLEEDLKYCEDYNENPDYHKMMRFYRRAKAAR
ncbi:MAG: twin-arginine translocation signal domain-containing protein [Proteobacteria bacterium]|nr:twin-arginine translocation signal domain-containing protein [Pseudomonadota bacterium]